MFIKARKIASAILGRKVKSQRHWADKNDKIWKGLFCRKFFFAYIQCYFETQAKTVKLAGKVKIDGQKSELCIIRQYRPGHCNYVAAYAETQLINRSINQFVNTKTCRPTTVSL